VDVDTGSGWITVGNQQLMSVPYALYAANGPMGPQGPAGEQGPSGADGIQGDNGFNSLMKTSAEPPGQNCNAGGIKVEVGLDSNNNNSLESNEINEASTQYVCNGSSIPDQNSADWRLPDGLSNIISVNWTLASSSSACLGCSWVASSTPYIVPEGKNLYIKSSAAGQVYGGCSPGIYCNGVQLFGAGCSNPSNPIVNNQIYILPQGSQITYNEGCISPFTTNCNGFAYFNGFLVDAVVNPILQISPLTVPTGQTFVIYSNAALPSFYTSGQTIPGGVNGYLITTNQ
jgi:hypothetical protein